MTNREFCYWLQGFFELGRDGGIDETQTRGIKAHLKLAHKVDGKLDEFCAWLEGMLEDKTHLSIEQTNKVRDRLNKQFSHVIDPTYGTAKTQEVLNKIHQQDKFDPTTSMIRC